MLAGIKQADTIFHMVFFIALTSVVIQGTAIPLLTRVLKIGAHPSDEVQSHPQLNPQTPHKPMP
jgi:cell volume regulation protein A